VKITGDMSEFSKLELDTARRDAPEDVVKLYCVQHPYSRDTQSFAVLLEKLGAPKYEVQRLMLTRPNLVKHDVATAVDTLMSIGVAPEDLPRTLRFMSDEVFAHGVRDALLAKVAALRELGLSSDAIANAVATSRQLLTAARFRHIHETASAFEVQLGVSKHQFGRVLSAFPRALDLKPELVKRQRIQLQLLGVPNTMLTAVVVAHPQLLLFARRQKFNSLLNFLISCGVCRADAAVLLVAVVPKMLSGLAATQLPAISTQLVDAFDGVLQHIVSNSTYALEALLVGRILPRMELLGEPILPLNGVLPAAALESDSEFVSNHLANVKLGDYLRFVDLIHDKVAGPKN